MYKELKDVPTDRHNLVTPADVIRARNEGRVYHPPTTIRTPYDERWYCKGCEQIFSEHDSFSARFLKGGGNLTGGAAQYHLQPGSDILPQVMVVDYEEAWRWPMSILSIAFRIHCSAHTQYEPIGIGAVAAQSIRRLLLDGSYDERLHSFDITSIITTSGGQGFEDKFATPAYGGLEADGSFQIGWGIWGMWFLVGSPYPAFKASALVPRFERSRVFVPVVAPETSIEWAANLFGGTIKD